MLVEHRGSPTLAGNVHNVSDEFLGDSGAVVVGSNESVAGFNEVNAEKEKVSRLDGCADPGEKLCSL